MSKQDDELRYGIDEGSPDGDKTALTIRVSQKVYTFVGEEAEAIIALIRSRERATRAEELKLTQRNLTDKNALRSFKENYYENRLAKLQKEEI